MKIAIIESPYRAETEFELRRNLAYARALVEHFVLRGFSANASHLLYTQCLDDRDPEQRRLGIEAGLALLRVADVHAFGVDLGVSPGMKLAMEKAKAHPNMAYEEVSLPEWAEAMVMNPHWASGFQAMETLCRRYQPRWHAQPRSK